MTPTKRTFTYLLLSLPLLTPSLGWAWGERGHHTICEVATRLVQEPALKSFLLRRGHQMGHLCNLPDIEWRQLGPKAKIGDQTHFLNPENMGWKIGEVPTDWAKVLKTKPLHGGKTASEALGSMWWRAEEFYNRGVKSIAPIAASGSHIPFPSFEEQQDADQPYNKAVSGFIVNVGLMGHFVGDASQPYHNDTDYDGWATGHGGIHSFYEGAVVDELPYSFVQEVYTKSLSLQKNWKQKGDTVVEVMKSLSEYSNSKLKDIEKADKVLSPSTQKLDANGEVAVDPATGRRMQTKAKRVAAADAVKGFKPLIVDQMAHSAVTLARLWDKAYADAGKPDLSKYWSYKYELSADFVVPGYIPASEISAITKNHDRKVANKNASDYSEADACHDHL